MLLAGVVVGHVARLAASAEERLQRAVELEAATRERERLARDIHDSVLQVLALVQRRGADLRGEAGELARLAGEQEAALRALIAGTGPAAGRRRTAATVDLRTLLGRYASATVSLSAPATPVPLPARVAGELAAAIGAALDNVARHAGGRAWVLVEDEGATVTVSIRDDGPGIPDGRLDEAAGAGSARRGPVDPGPGRRRWAARFGSCPPPGAGTEIELTRAEVHRGEPDPGDGGRRPSDVAGGRGPRPDRGRLRGGGDQRRGTAGDPGRRRRPARRGRPRPATAGHLRRRGDPAGCARRCPTCGC